MACLAASVPMVKPQHDLTRSETTATHARCQIRFAGCQHHCSLTTLSLTLPGTQHVSGLPGRLTASLTDLSRSHSGKSKAVSRHGICQAYPQPQHCSSKAGLTRKTRLVHLSGMPCEPDSAWHAFLIHPCKKSGWRTYDGVTFN